MRTLIIAGASGFLGTALSQAARRRGWQVKTLVRRAPMTTTEIAWNPAAGQLARADIAGADAIVCLAGAPIAGGLWTAKRRQIITTSRTATTGLLSRTIASLRPADRPDIFISGSAIGYYGDRGNEQLTETANAGCGFLSGVCQAWEAAATGAIDAGVRTVFARTGNVIDREGGLLQALLPAYRAHLGARLGDGTQYFATIWRRDWVEAICFILEHPTIAGPVNLVAPGVQSFADFHHEIERALGRRSPAVIPAGLLQLAGAMGKELLLASQRVVPQVLCDHNFTFRAPTLQATVRRAISPEL
ncbi:MAG: TIGR01777 family oxidoreductase [Bowdeniella nasicola]|nr:TIGR01777 family oxidoreductase [Bowdeniella nasicola]